MLATETEFDDLGNLTTEEFIVGVQPIEGTFYMISIDDGELVFGDICKKSGIIDATVIEQKSSIDDARIEIFQYTNLGM